METKTVGDRIKVLCSTLGISQQTIATLTGVKLTVINKAARNVYTPSIQVLRDIATGLMVSESWLAFGEGRIFPVPFVLLTVTVESGKQPGGRSHMMSPHDAHDLAEYVFGTESVRSCYVLRDVRRPDPVYYLCACDDLHCIIFAADSFTGPGLDQLLLERPDIETVRVSAISDNDEQEQPAMDMYIAIAEMYSPAAAMDLALEKLRESVKYLIPDLARTLQSAKVDDILSPGRLAARQKVHLLVKYFEDLNVEEEDIDAAARIYLDT